MKKKVKEVIIPIIIPSNIDANKDVVMSIVQPVIEKCLNKDNKISSSDFYACLIAFTQFFSFMVNSNPQTVLHEMIEDLSENEIQKDSEKYHNNKEMVIMGQEMNVDLT